ncbi:MAG: hypothetical protein ABSF77_13820 [Spirochaetia bacterium]
MESPSDSIARFATRLLETPNLRQLSALQKEEQALQFLRANGQQLLPVFASLGLDVSRGWREPAALIARALRSESDRLMEGELAAFFSSRLGLSFFPALAGGRQAPGRTRDELRILLQRVSRHPIARGALAGSFPAAQSDLADRYIPQAYERKKFIYVEITRVQRLGLSPAELVDLVRLTLLLRPAAYLFITPGETIEKDAGFAPLQEPYLQKILPSISSQLPSFPGPIVSMGLRGTLAFPDTTNVEAISRIAFILALRGRSLTPSLVVDRGADTPDKSWFNVNRKNAKWHGLDARMLDELYTIAAENGW